MRARSASPQSRAPPMRGAARAKSGGDAAGQSSCASALSHFGKSPCRCSRRARAAASASGAASAARPLHSSAGRRPASAARGLIYARRKKKS